MKMHARQIIVLITIASLLPGTARAVDAAPAPVRIVIVGDSTVSNYPPGEPTRGWGQFIQERFKDGTVSVINLATPGRSTKTFIEEGRWQKALAEKPDYVLIQFGHNDSHPPGNKESTNAATDYKDYLRRYIDDARSIGATPILVTPMVRRSFDASGKIADGTLPPPSGALKPYADAMKEVAKEKNVPVIDLYTASKELADKIGPAESDKFANKAGDHTHFNEKGARAMADLVMKELPLAAPGLERYLKSEPP
jgi:lysophospholipase L1-like esterase